MISIWMILVVAAFILTMSMLGLFLTNLAFTAKNMTHIDALKGTFTFRDTKGLFPNPFDLGIITNYSMLF